MLPPKMICIAPWKIVLIIISLFHLGGSGFTSPWIYLFVQTWKEVKEVYPHFLVCGIYLYNVTYVRFTCTTLPVRDLPEQAYLCGIYLSKVTCQIFTCLGRGSMWKKQCTPTSRCVGYLYKVTCMIFTCLGRGSRWKKQCTLTSRCNTSRQRSPKSWKSCDNSRRVLKCTN